VTCNSIRQSKGGLVSKSHFTKKGWLAKVMVTFYPAKIFSLEYIKNLVLHL